MLMTSVSLARKFVWPECRESEANVFSNEIERYRCPMLMATPAGIAELIKSQRANPRDIRCLSLCVVSGDVSRSELYDEFQQTFGKTHEERPWHVGSERLSKTRSHEQVDAGTDASYGTHRR